MTLYTRDPNTGAWIPDPNVELLLTNHGPALANLSQIKEGESIRITGSFTDASPLDTHSVEINWSGAGITQAVVDPGTRTFDATFTFLDNIRGDIRVRLSDDDGDSVFSQPIGVDVANVNPTAAFLPGVITNPNLIPLHATATDPGSIHSPTTGPPVSTASFSRRKAHYHLTLSSIALPTSATPLS